MSVFAYVVILREFGYVKKDIMYLYFYQTSVSFGNVSQLTTELLLEHLNAKLLGFIVDDAVLPVTGRQPLSDDLHKLCANLEGN